MARLAFGGEDRVLSFAVTAREGLARLHDLRPDLVVLAMDLRDLPGLRALHVFKERAPHVPVVCVSSVGSVALAVEAMRNGAADMLVRPVSPPQLAEAVSRALRDVRTRRDLARAREQAKDRYGFSHLLTRSPKMLRVFDQVRAVAGTDATALIMGETGTGKELISRAIHERSRRKDKPLISINCGAFTETLLESELFGHEKGSFTGAQARREGVFEMADGGTLFLDELGETSLNVQVNLLRVLEEMRFRRVGGTETVEVDVRVIAATNVQLEQAVASKKFREDLYYRLNVFPIHLPPLRERREDIPLLVRHFLDDAAQEYGLEAPTLSAEAMERTIAYRWPGNVRQLRAMCERWLITRAGQRLEADHLPPDMLAGPGAAPTSVDGFPVDPARPMNESVERAVSQIERAYLEAQLRAHGGHLDQTAAAAGITRRTLYTKLKELGMDAADFKPRKRPDKGP